MSGTPLSRARLARGRMRARHDALVAALDGRFEDHHAQIISILLGKIDFLDKQIT